MPRVGDYRNKFRPPITSTPIIPLMERQKRPPSPSDSEHSGPTSKNRRTVSPIASISSHVNGAQRISEDRLSEESSIGQRPDSTSPPANGSLFPAKGAGWIKKIELENFLIHSKYSLELEPSVNFITGANGSGKSSIASAIAVGLGGRSSLTDRKGKLAEFVKNGKKSAFISITLSNEGRNAYQPDVWGKTIVVERRFEKSKKSSNNAGYRILGENGGKIGDTLEKLKQILSRMNIQIDNPVFFLNQRMSKEFLQKASTETLYQFFYQALGFDSVEDANQGSEKKLQEAKRAIARVQVDLATLERKLQDKIAQRDFAIDEKVLYERLEEAKRNRLYYEYQKQKQEQDDLGMDVARIRDDIDRIQGELDDKENLTQVDEELRHTLKTSKDEEKYRVLKDKKLKELTKAKERFEEGKKSLRSIRRKATKIKSASPKSKKRAGTTTPGLRPSPVPSGEQSAAQWARSLTSSNRTLNNSTMNGDVSNRARVEKSLRENKEEEEHLDYKLARLEARQQELLELLKEVDDVDEKLREKTIEVEQLGDGVARTWQNSISENAMKVGEMLSVMTEEDRKGCKIYGPIASEISLRSKKFATAADEALGSLLEAFVLWTPSNDNAKEHLKVLEGVKDGCRSEGFEYPHFFCLDDDALKADTFSIDREEVKAVASDALFLTDVVKVGKNHRLKSLLRNILPIRNVVFVESGAVAQLLSLSDIPGLEKVYDAAGFCYGVENGTWSVTAPAERTVMPPTMKSFTQVLAKAEGELVELTGKKHLLRERSEELLRVKGQITELKDQMTKVIQQSVSATNQLNFIQPFLSQQSAIDLSVPLDRPSTSRSSVPRSSVARSMDENETDDEEEVERSHNTPEEDNDELTRLNASITVGTEANKTLKGNIKKLDVEYKAALKNYEMSKRATLPASTRTRGAIKEKQEAVKKLKTDLDRLQKELNEKTASKATCDSNMQDTEEGLADLGVEDPEEIAGPEQSYDEVMKAVKELDQQQQDLVMTQDKISRRQLEKEIKVLESEKRDGEQKLEMSRLIQDCMSDNVDQRVVNKEKGLARAADQAQKHCVTLMEEQGFKCRLTISTEEKKVEYLVAPRSTTVLGPLNVLSGGERSMALAALLTAFWDQGAPFRVLDEFEVCMDICNREAAMKFLVERALYDSAQCIFFSPLDTDLKRIAKPGVIHRVELKLPQRETQDEEGESEEEG